MAATFESRLSMSVGRQPLSLSSGPSAAESLPSVNFGFDDLRDRMAKFTARFDAFIEQNRKRVLEERNQFRIEVAELQGTHFTILSHPDPGFPSGSEEDGCSMIFHLANLIISDPQTEDQRMKKKDIEILQLRTASHQQTVAKEAAEKREMQAAVATLTEQRDRQLAERDSLKRQLAQAEAELARREAARRDRLEALEAQARFNVPELDFWISNLCMRIDGAGRDDRLRFVFTHVDERDWDREAWFELCTAERDYDVRHTGPKLPRDKVERVLDRVNETRDLAVLLKGMRDLFVEAMKA